MNSIEARNTYISLFSSGGIGDLGFHDENYECLASAELISRRIEVQRLNGIATPDRLICGDILLPGTYAKIIEQAKNYVDRNRQPVTAIIATPPCQGMSVANHKKGDELGRNSLVVKSIEVIKEVEPLVFIFENVPSFMKTTCTGMDGNNRAIGDEIERELGHNYEYLSRTLQLSEYGSPSSRKRSITIGVRNDVTWVTPLDLFPERKEAPSLYELIGDLPKLNEMGTCASEDIFHSFRPYAPRMRNWIRDLPEGASAFDNDDPSKRPHRVIDGEIVPNVRKNGDKYRRVRWDAVAPCVHTRNDILASQNTIHPVDDRVFSIRELMRMMGVREDFIWFDGQEEAYRTRDFKTLKKHAINIRQCLGEAVPVPVTQSIASNIKEHLTSHLSFSAGKPRRSLTTVWSTFSQESSYLDVPANRKKNYSAYYTEPLVAFSLVKRALAKFDGKTNRVIKVLEPSAGSGVFVEVLNQFAEYYKINLTSVELEPEISSYLTQRFNRNHNFVAFNSITADFLELELLEDFDLVIGNPPFGRRPIDLENKWGKDKELSVRFLKKSLSISTQVAFVLPKALLHAAYYRDTRDHIVERSAIDHILDFGEFTFPDVKVETVGLVTAPIDNSEDFEIGLKSWPRKLVKTSRSSYILDREFPNWVIYRDQFFDSFVEKTEFGQLSVWRDRTISRKYAVEDGVRVLRGRNLSADGTLIDDSRDYEISELNALRLQKSVSGLVGDNKFLAPNLSYKPRLVPYRNAETSVPEGSCAVLYGNLTDIQAEKLVKFCCSADFEMFYRIACNFATRSINIDDCLVYWWGVPR